MTNKSHKGEQLEEMVDFIVSNLVAKKVNQEGRFIEVIDHKDNPFLIVPYSSATKEFVEDTGFHPTNNPDIVDNDRVNLYLMTAHLFNFIRDVNIGFALPEGGLLQDYIGFIKTLKHGEKPVTPIFILQQSDTDFSQVSLTGRVDTIVNRAGNFNKQVLGTKHTPKPFFSKRKLLPLELALWGIYQHTDRELSPTERRYNGYGFLPSTYVFNPKAGHIQENWYKHGTVRVKTPTGWKDKDYRFFREDPFSPKCIFSSEDANNKLDKKSKPYRNYVIARGEARYSKTLCIMNERHERQIGSHNDEEGIRFNPVHVSSSYVKKFFPYSKRLLQVGVLR